MFVKNLKLCAWNIHGYNSRLLGNKLQNENFLETIRDVDFLSLTEIHIHDEILENLCIPGFRLISHKNRKKNLKSNTVPGGIRVFVKENSMKYFSAVNHGNEDIVWAKINKEASGEKNDIFIGTCYFSPTRGGADNDIKISTLMEDICSFQSKGHVLICGDLNAWTGNSDDTIPPDKYDSELGILSIDNPRKRNSQHKSVNNRGLALLDICKTGGSFWKFHWLPMERQIVS